MNEVSMEATAARNEIKSDTTETMEKAEKQTDERGRMSYRGIDMAYIYIRGDLMFTMSEVSRNLYPKWPRTTLNDRVKTMNIRWYTCTPTDIEKVLSVKGIVKFGVHCTLISKHDLDMFTKVYKIGSSPGKKQRTNEKRKQGNENDSYTSQRNKLKKPKRAKCDYEKISFDANSASQRTYNELNVNHGILKQKAKTHKRVNSKRTQRVHVKIGHKKNTFVEDNNKSNDDKQSHVLKAHSPKDARPGNLSKSKFRKFLNGIDQSEHGNSEQDFDYEYIPTKRYCINTQNAGATEDARTFDNAGISSKQPDKRVKKKHCPRPNVNKQKPAKIVKQVKRKYVKLKVKKAAENDALSGKGRKNGLVKRVGKRKNQVALKRKMRKVCGRRSTITKDLIMKMDLKDLNDKDLINSLSPPNVTGSNNSTPSTGEEQSYQVKLMPVKPVWRVNTNFRFISNFQLPPSLTVQDGQLGLACSMVCGQGKKPPSAHPIWKWRVGEPVIGNKTEISYRVKKVKCGKDAFGVNT